jgi:hypothetical protein
MTAELKDIVRQLRSLAENVAFRAASKSSARITHCIASPQAVAISTPPSQMPSRRCRLDSPPDEQQRITLCLLRRWQGARSRRDRRRRRCIAGRRSDHFGIAGCGHGAQARMKKLRDVVTELETIAEAVSFRD